MPNNDYYDYQPLTFRYVPNDIDLKSKMYRLTHFKIPEQYCCFVFKQEIVFLSNFPLKSLNISDLTARYSLSRVVVL